MSEFLGKKVEITTKDFTVQGTVLEIADGRLVLDNAFSQTTGERLPRFIVEGSQITNVEFFKSKRKPKGKGKNDGHIAQRRNGDSIDSNESTEPYEPAPKEVKELKLPREPKEKPQEQLQKQPQKQPNEQIKVQAQKPSVPIPIATPLQLSQILTQMISVGYTPEGMAERAAESLSKHISVSKSHSIVFLVGAHSVGNWAIATARRLSTNGYNVVAVSPSTAAVGTLERQNRSFIASGGRFVTSKNALLGATEGQKIGLVVDALEGYEAPLVDQLDTDEYNAAKWLIEWSGCALKRISIYNAAVENSSVVACGFPTQEGAAVVDLGIPNTLLQTLKLRRFVGNWFH